MSTSETKVVRTMCPMSCHPTFCGMLAETKDGKLVGTTGDKDNPDSRGFLCVRGQNSHEVIGNPKRLLRPMIRSSTPVGSGSERRPSARSTCPAPRCCWRRAPVA